MSLLLHAEYMKSQTFLEDFFINTKAEALALLSRNARLDLLDYYNNKMPAQAENAFKGVSKLTNKTNSLLQLDLTAVSRCELFLDTSQSGDSVVIILHQIKQPIASFKVEVRNLQDSVLHTSLKMPTAEEFCETPGCSKDEEHALVTCGFVATIDEHLKGIKVTLATNLLPKSFQNNLKQKVTQISYVREGGKFVVK